MSTRSDNKNQRSADEGFRWLELDESDLFYLLRKHAVLLVAAPIIGFIAAVAISLTIRPQFSTSVTAYLRPNFDKEMQLDRNFSKMEDADSLSSIERAMVSDTVILKMVDRLGLREDPDFLGEQLRKKIPLTDAKLLKEIRDRYETKLVPTTRLITLTVFDYSPERTAVIANTLIEEFLTHLKADRNTKEAELRTTLTTQSESALKSALKAEEKLKQFRLKHPEYLVEQDSQIFHERLLQLGQSLNEARSEQSQLAGILATLEPIDPKEDPYRVFQILSNRNREYLSELLAMHANARTELASKKQRFAEKHPQYQEALSRLTEVEMTLQNYATEMKNGLTSEHDAASEKVNQLDESLDKLQGDFIGFKTVSADFRGLKEEIDRNWNTYSKLQQRIMDLDLDPETTPTFVTVVSDPVVPDKKARPRRLFWAAGGTLLGMLAALGTVLVRNRRGLPFTTPEQSTRILKRPTVATLQISGRTIQEKIARMEQEPEFLNLLISLQNTQVIHVTALGDDRTNAELIPMVLARRSAGRSLRTLIIAFGTDLPPERSAIQSSGSQNLSTLELNADVLLNLDRFRAGLQTLLGDFDRLILDTTRVAETEARLAISAVAEANVLTVSGGDSTPRSEYERYLEHCASYGVHSTGIVYLKKASASDRSRRPRINFRPLKLTWTGQPEKATGGI